MVPRSSFWCLLGYIYIKTILKSSLTYHVWRNEGGRIYVRKSRVKSFWKKPVNKNFRKKSEFSKVLGKNVTRFLGLFSKNWGHPIKSREIRSQEIKSSGKYIRRKKSLILWKWDQVYKNVFIKKDFFTHLYFKYSHVCVFFISIAPLFCMVVNILCFMQFLL